MIKSMTFKNFRSHKKTEFKFHKGVNVLVGTTRSGKTNTIRGLNWIVNNKPSGNSYRSHWGGETFVEIKLDDTSLYRLKNKKINDYCHKTEIYKAFGQDVPEEIKKLLNFSTLNLQNQHDTAFLLSNTSGEVAKYLNKIVHLESIDRAMKNINKTLSNEETDKKLLEEDIIDLKEKKKEFRWLKEAEGVLSELENERRKYTREKKSLEKLQDTIEEIKFCDIELEKWGHLDKQKSDLNKCEKLNKKVEDEEATLITLEARIKKIKDLDWNIEMGGRNLGCMKADFERLMPDTCPLCGRSG